jgi:hypothetical protein
VTATHRLSACIVLPILWLSTSCTSPANQSAERIKNIPSGWIKVLEHKDLSFYAPRDTVEIPTQTFECCGNRFRNSTFSIMYFFSTIGNGFDKSQIDESDTVTSRQIDNNYAKVVYGINDNPDCEGRLFETIYIAKNRFLRRSLYLNFTVCAGNKENLRVADRTLNTIRFGR